LGQQNTVKKKPLLKYILKFGISAVLLYYILKGTNFHDILTAIGKANWFLLAVSFSFHFIGLYLSAQRWRVLLSAQNVGSGVFHLVKSYLVAMFFNNFLPSTVGGDAVRVYDSYKLGKKKADAFTVVFIDRFLGLFVLLFFAFVSAFFAKELSDRVPHLHLFISLAFFGALVFLVNIFFPNETFIRWISHFPGISSVPKFKYIIEKFGSSFLLFRSQRPAIMKGLLLSVLLQANVIIYYYIISIAVGFQVPLYYFFLIVPLSLFIMMLPISLNGIGLRENAFFFFLAAFGIVKADAIAFAWIEFGMVLIQGICGGIIYALRK